MATFDLVLLTYCRISVSYDCFRAMEAADEVLDRMEKRSKAYDSSLSEEEERKGEGREDGAKEEEGSTLLPVSGLFQYGVVAEA